MIKVKRIMKHYFSLEGNMFRYSLSYGFLLALLPMLVILVILFQKYIFETSILIRFLFRFIPQDMITTFLTFIMEKEIKKDFSFLLILGSSIYMASRSIYTFLLVSAIDEKIVIKSIWLRVKSIYVLVISIVVSMGIIALCYLLKIKVMIDFSFLLFFILYFLYRMLSFENRPLTYGLLGAFIALVGIEILGNLFFYLIYTFTSYKSIYGPLASLIILFLSVYFISSIIYLGYCINLEYGSSYSNKKYKKIVRFTGEKYESKDFKNRD